MSTIVSNREFLKALGLAVAALAASAALLVGGYLLLAPVLHPEFKSHLENDKAAPIAISGNRFRPVVFGDGGFEGSAAVISALAEAAPEDHAVLVHKRVFEAERFAFFGYHIEGRNPALRVTLFWQRADTPGENHFAELDYSGDGPGLHNLLRSEEWRGTITELAVGFFGDLRGEPVKLHGVGLEPYSSGRLLEAVWREWTAFAPWDQASINAYRAVNKYALVYPVPVVAAWAGLAAAIVVLTWLVNGKSQRSWAGAICVVLIGWLLLDGMWLKQLFFQNMETKHLFAGKGLHEKKLADWDGEYYAAVPALKDHVGSEAGNFIILYQENHAALAQRMRFHLLPELNASTIRPIRRKWLEGASREFDHVIVMSAPGTTPSSHKKLQEALTGKLAGDLSLIWTQGPVALYATSRAELEGDA